MADHNVTIVISADASQVPAALSKASAAYRSFASQTNAAASGANNNMRTSAQAAGRAVNNMGNQVSGATGQIKSFASIAGMASAVLASFKSQSNFFAGAAAGFKTLVSEIATVMPIVLGVRAAMYAIQTGIRFVVDSFVDFNKAMTESTAIMGDLSETMEKDLGKAARDVATITTFSAAEAAKGIYFIASAGFDAKSSMEALPVAAKFAQAGLMDMEKATEMLLDVTNAYGKVSRDAFGQIDSKKTVENMTEISDVITRGAIDSNATIEQLSASLTNKAAGAARMLGKDIKETMSVLEAFASVGIKGAVAGTQLSIIWRDLSTKAIKNSEDFKKFGIEVFDANGNMNDTAAIMNQLSGSLGKMSDETKKATLLQLGFTDRSVQAMLAVMDLGGEMQRYRAHLELAAGATDSVAQKQLRSLASTFEILRNQVGNFVIVAGEALLQFAESVGKEIGPTVANLGDAIREVVSALTPMITSLVKVASIPVGVAFKVLYETLDKAATVAKTFKVIVADLIMFLGVRAVLSSRLFATSMTQAAGAAYAANNRMSAVIATTAATHQAAATSMQMSNARIGASWLSAGQKVQVTAYQTQAAFEAVHAQLYALGATTTVVATGWRAKMASMAASSKQFALTAVDSGKQAGNGIRGAIGKAANSASLLLLPLMNMMMTLSEADSKAQSMIDAATMENDKNTVEGLNKSLQSTFKIAKDAHDAMPEEGFFSRDFAQTKAGLKAMIGLQDEELDRLKREDKASEESIKIHEQKTQALKNFSAAHAAGVGNIKYFERSVKDLGLSISMSDEDYKKNEKAIVMNAHALAAMAKNVPPAMRAMATDSDEAMTDMAESSEDLRKKFVENIEALHDPMKAYKEAVKETFDLSDIYSDVENDNEEAAQRQEEAMDASTEAQVEAIQAQIDNLEKSKKLYGQAQTDINNDFPTDGKKGKTRKEAIQDETRDTKNAYDDQIEMLRKQQEALRDVDRSVEPESPNFSAFMAKLKEKSEDVDVFETNIELLRKASKKAGDVIPESFIKGIEQLGPEKGLPILREMLRSLTFEQDQFVERWGAQFKQMSQAPIDEWLKTINDRATAAKEMMLNSMAIIDAAQGGLGLTAVQRMTAELGEDAPAAIKQLADLARSADPADQAKFQELIKSFGVLAKNTGEEADKTLALVQTIEDGNVDQIKAMIGEMDPNTISQLFVDSGVPEKYLEAVRLNLGHIMQGIKADIEALLNDAGKTYEEKLEELKKKWAEQKTAQERVDAADSAGANERAREANENPLNGPGYEVIQAWILEHPNGEVWSSVEELINWAKAHNPPLMANGGILGFSGGEVHQAMIAPPSTRIWAEPETGGEAYIPLAQAKRARSVRTLNSVAEMFGYSLQRYANGGMYKTPLSYQTPGNRQNLQVIPMPIEAKRITNFNGDIRGLTMEEVMMYKERKERQAGLTGGW